MLTPMYNAVLIVEVHQTFEDGHGKHGYDFNIDWTDFFVYPIEGALVHKFHANANVWFGQKCTIKRDDVLRLAVMHDLQLSQDLLSYAWLRIDQHNLKKRDRQRTIE